MKNNLMTIIPIPKYYRFKLSDYYSVDKFFYYCADFDCWFVKDSDFDEFKKALNSLILDYDDDVFLVSIVHELLDDISITLEEDACPVINRF